MEPSPRARAILDAISATGTGRIPDLSRRLGVTEETIRRNLRRMEEAGLVTRLRGGVRLRDRVGDRAGEASFVQRFAENASAKQRIAAHLAGMIADGATLFMDVGATTAHVAQALRVRHELMVVTNSLPVAQALVSHNGNRVFMAGGELRAHDAGAFGDEALSFVRQFRVRHAVLSAAAVQADGGFALHDLREAEFSRAIIDCAEQAIIAADASKFTRSAPIRLTDPARIATLVTDAPPPPAIARMLTAAEVRVEIAPPLARKGG